MKKTMTILVADDDPVIRKLFEKRLQMEGYEVSVAADGAEAARVLDKKHFDVVITDLVMPGSIAAAMACIVFATTRPILRSASSSS